MRNFHLLLVEALDNLGLNKAHIGEVQASIWDEKNIKICRENDINLL